MKKSTKLNQAKQKKTKKSTRIETFLKLIPIFSELHGTDSKLHGELHDSIDDVIVVIAQSLDSLGSRDGGLIAHQVYILGGDTGLVNFFLDNGWSLGSRRGAASEAWRQDLRPDIHFVDVSPLRLWPRDPQSWPLQKSHSCR